MASAGSVLLHPGLDYGMGWNVAVIPAWGENEHAAPLLRSVILHFMAIVTYPWPRLKMGCYSPLQSPISPLWAVWGPGEYCTCFSLHTQKQERDLRAEVAKRQGNRKFLLLSPPSANTLLGDKQHAAEFLKPINSIAPFNVGESMAWCKIELQYMASHRSQNIEKWRGAYVKGLYITHILLEWQGLCKERNLTIKPLQTKKLKISFLTKWIFCFIPKSCRVDPINILIVFPMRKRFILCCVRKIKHNIISRSLQGHLNTQVTKLSLYILLFQAVPGNLPAFSLAFKFIFLTSESSNRYTFCLKAPTYFS